MNAPARIFESRPAVRTQVPLLIGLMSPSGGGKTYSALRLATGIQQVFGGDIYGLDTENNRMLHYADMFRFQHVPFSAPFGSLDYLAALQYCAGKGSRITIVDSMTHEHIGQGGYLETAEAIVDRIAGNDYKKREAVKMLGWATAGPLRQKMIEGIKQLDGAFIFCFRAKEKVKPVRKPDGNTEVVDMGFMPIAGEEWVYEMSLSCMLVPRSEGIPTWRSDHVGERLMMKLPEQFKGIFAESAPLSEEIGRRLAEWAKGGVTSSNAGPDVLTAARQAAGVGRDALQTYWKTLSQADKKAANAIMEELKAIALKAEAEPQASPPASAESFGSAEVAAGAEPTQQPAAGQDGPSKDDTPEEARQRGIEAFKAGEKKKVPTPYLKTPLSLEFQDGWDAQRAEVEEATDA